MQPELADRVKSYRQSDIRRFSAICAAMGGINLSQGVCDQPAPAEVKQAAKTAIDDDQAVYTNLRGIAELREAIARKMAEFNGVICDPEREIVVSVGSAGAFACASFATLNPGDEVIVFSPFYGYHVHMLKLVGAKIKYVDMKPPDWSFDSGQLAEAFTDRTRMVVINTPANPTGKVFTEDELREIGHLAAANSAWIVTDEIYEYITYDGREHVSIKRLEECSQNTITLSGASKTYSVTGWRIGYAVGPESVIEKMSVINDMLYICAPAPLQHGVAAGLGLPQSYYDNMLADYTVKREMLSDALRKGGFQPFTPQGSYYTLASFEPGRWKDATEATEQILERVAVATVPGAAFYRNPADGVHQLRFCYAKKMKELEDACSRLATL